jgi:hypothetical protein
MIKEWLDRLNKLDLDPTPRIKEDTHYVSLVEFTSSINDLAEMVDTVKHKHPNSLVEFKDDGCYITKKRLETESEVAARLLRTKGIRDSLYEHLKSEMFKTVFLKGVAILKASPDAEPEDVWIQVMRDL